MNKLQVYKYSKVAVPALPSPCPDFQVCAIVSWDSSIHDSVHLNRVTPANERGYLILKAIVRLSHPAAMELVLRKRVCINVYKRQSITDKLKKRIGKAVSLMDTRPPCEP